MKLNKLFTLPSILIQLGILIIFSFYLFPKYHEPIKAGASKPYQTLDVTIGYDKAFVIDLFETIGEAGKRQYARIEKEIDMIFPILYTLFFYSVIKYLSIQTQSSSLSKSASFTLMGVCADISENTIVLYCLNSIPNDISANLVSLCSILTITKYTVISLSLFVIIVLLIKLFMQKLNILSIKN